MLGDCYMWEFSVGMDSDKVDMAKYIYNNLKDRVKKLLEL